MSVVCMPSEHPVVEKHASMWLKQAAYCTHPTLRCIHTSSMRSCRNSMKRKRTRLPQSSGSPPSAENPNASSCPDDLDRIAEPGLK